MSYPAWDGKDTRDDIALYVHRHLYQATYGPTCEECGQPFAGHPSQAAWQRYFCEEIFTC